VKFIVGLGNPGKKYARTRHNLGFFVIDRLAKQHEVALTRKFCGALIGEWLCDRETIFLAKPQAFMNRSGEVVEAILREYDGTAENLIVVYDDLDLPFGRIRIRSRGSAGGHRGISSILEHLAGAPFDRVRIGIGRPPEGTEPADFVLTPFDSQELAEVEAMVDRAADAVTCLARNGVQRAMELYNRAP
jgi:PTH1 family peptidyl-tRNA hydrolase